MPQPSMPTRLPALALIACAALASVASAAPGDGALQQQSWRADDGTRVLQQSIEVPASAADVWAAFTTSEGFRAWAAPVTQVDFRLGGFIESSYDPTARIGEQGNIRNEIVAYVPLRMLAIRNRQAPPNTAFDVPTFQQLHTVISLEALDAKRTRVTIAQPGFGNSEAFDGVYRHFERGNGWSLQQLRQRFEKGPKDWSELRTAPPPQTR